MTSAEDSVTDVVERAKAALECVTEGPWVWSGTRLDGGRGGYDEIVWPGQVSCMSYCYGGSSTITADNPERDWPFIAAARSLVPELVAEVERLRAEIAWGGKHDS